MPNSTPKIKIQSLYKVFGAEPKKSLVHVKNGVDKETLLEKHKHVLGLQDINMDIHDGSIHVVMGLSGSGKSTLIRHINRLIEPTAGALYVDETNVLNLNKKELLAFRRHQTAMVFQKFALLPHKTIIDNVTFGLFIQGVSASEATKKAQTWIDRVGLSGFEKHYPKQLSGGMQQRVGLARALCNDADVLLMDEAFSALDPLIRKDMQDMLLQLQDELHKTIVFITHDLDEALRIGDQICILKDGALVQNGTPEEIILNPANDYVADFVKDVNRLKVLRAKTVMMKAAEYESSDNDNVGEAAEECCIEEFLPEFLTGKIDVIAVKDKENAVVGYVTKAQLSDVLLANKT